MLNKAMIVWLLLGLLAVHCTAEGNVKKATLEVDIVI